MAGIRALALESFCLSPRCTLRYTASGKLLNLRLSLRLVTMGIIIIVIVILELLWVEVSKARVCGRAQRPINLSMIVNKRENTKLYEWEGGNCVGFAY